MTNEQAPSAESTAKSIENVARMQAKKADQAGVYDYMAPLAPEGYSQVGGHGVPMLGDKEVYVKETGQEPGAELSPVKIKLSSKATGKSVKLSTEGGVVSGEVRDEHRDENLKTLDDVKDMREVAAAALWAKRKEIRKAEDRKKQDTQKDLQDVIGK